MEISHNYFTTAKEFFEALVHRLTKEIALLSNILHLKRQNQKNQKLYFTDNAEMTALYSAF